jgi:hypothetical protein
MKALTENELLDGRYRLIQKKGSGSYGEVWLANDEQLNIEVAVKVYFALDDASNNELKSEFINTFDLNHPNLLHSFYYGRCEDRSYIVMPYCPTTSVQHIGCCNEQMAWNFVSDVANGLAYLHDHDIVHHDIKPDNILIGANGHYVISDFGISTQLRNNLHHNSGRDDINSSKVSGSIAYMGPEMFLEEPFSAKATDIWAFGASLYEMISGTLPFYGQGGVLQNSGAQLPEVPFDFVSSNLVNLIHDCLAKEPWDRPTAHEIAKYADLMLNDGTAPEWAEYFKECRTGDPSTTSDPGTTGDRLPEPKPKKWWIGVAAASIVLIGVGIVLAVMFGHKKTEPLVEEIIPIDTAQHVNALANLEPIQATYLKVNGSEKPKTVTMASYDTLKVVSVDTDGAFTIKEDLPKWLSLNKVTDSSFVLCLEPNKTAKKRAKTLEIVSGDIVRTITIVQAPDKKKELKSRLSPAQQNQPSVAPASSLKLTLEKAE